MSDTSTLFTTGATDDNWVTLVTNANKRFRDCFATAGTQPNPLVWNTTNTNNDHIITQWWNSSGASYLRISLNPLVDNSEVTLTSIDSFEMPFRTGFGISMSQRISGQEVFVWVLWDDWSGNVQNITPSSDITIDSATASITTNVATFTVTNHWLKWGDRVSIINCPECRLNVWPVVATVTSENTFTVPCTLANGSYSTVGGSVRFADPLRWAYNGAGYLFESTTSTTASSVSRRNGSKFRTSSATHNTTVATQANTSAFTDSFNSAGNFEQYVSLEEVLYRSFASDSSNSQAGFAKYTQWIPDENPTYHINVRARNISGMTKPVARIANIAKTGTTTATVTTDVPHWLITGNFIQIYGVRDIVNFPNLVASTTITVLDSLNFTVLIGTATTTSSTGWAVYLNQWSVLAPGVLAQNIQSLSRTSNILTVIGNTTWATPLPGEYFYLYGMTGSATQYEGGYKVLRVNTTSLYLESVWDDFVSINTGGAMIRMTDVRLHFARVLDYTRFVAEIVWWKWGTTDQNNAVQVYNSNNITSLATVTTVTSVSSVIAANLSLPGVIADIASAALTTTTTTAAVNPTFWTGYVVSVPVTVVSGTTPTLDFTIQESDDTGTNWYNVYDFPRITTTGIYRSPNILLRGNRVRYVQTVSGTTPSFTRAINRLQTSDNIGLFIQSIDRSISLTTLNAVTLSLLAEGCKNFTMTLTLWTAATPPVMQLEGSDSWLANEWYAIGGTLTGVASTSSSITISPNSAKFIRARVQTIWVTIGAGYSLSIKWF